MGKKWISLISAMVISISALAMISVYLLLHRSLAELDGEITLASLSADVRVDRDAEGVVTLIGKNRLDLARATGFVHAQERFFQMDLLRRRAAGELSALVGRGAIEWDKKIRPHRFRHRAKALLQTLAQNQLDLLSAYQQGVNAGLSALQDHSFEYLLLDTTPEPWQQTDTVLCAFALFIELQDEEGKREKFMTHMRMSLPDSVFQFLTPAGTDWDAALNNDFMDQAPLPPKDDINLRQADAMSLPLSAVANPLPVTGSNNWAVGGALTESGSAMLAGDMHQQLNVPNIWFRLRLEIPDQLALTGVSLPGTPLIIAGTNGKIAWSFTNSFADFSDRVLIKTNDDGSQYLSTDGWRAFDVIKEVIAVHDQDPITIEIKETIWGPIIDQDHLGRQHALKWIAHDANAINLNLYALESTALAEDAIEIAIGAGIPGQNFVVADHNGNIAWTLAGILPKRFGETGNIAQYWHRREHGWQGRLEPSAYPRVINPASGRIWTANNRVVAKSSYTLLGDDGYDVGARAKQIQNRLLAKQQFNETDFLAIQLDNQALYLGRWQSLLINFLAQQTQQANASSDDKTIAETAHKRPNYLAIEAAVRNWQAAAVVASVGYRIVKQFRLQVVHHLITPLVAKLQSEDPEFNYFNSTRQEDGPVWAIITAKPAHLLPKPFPHWDAFFDYCLQQAIASIRAEQPEAGDDLSQYTWGQYNQVRISHPLARFLPPVLQSFLSMPTTAMPGDANIINKQKPTHGVSQRLIVSPGYEDKAIFHMPTGQSGHPLSPFFKAGHEHWVKGEPSPLLPMRAKHQLWLKTTTTHVNANE